MANPYGRKGKNGAAATLDGPVVPQDDPQQALVQKQLLALQHENLTLAQKLQDALVNIETLKGGGSVAILPECEAEGLELSKDASSITAPTPDNQADFGPVSVVRVYSDNAPAGVKIPCVVQVAKKAPNGKIAGFRRKFYTDTEIELPEWAIKTLEYPEDRDYTEEIGSSVYEAAMRGDMGPAKEACQKMGFERVVWQGEQLKYLASIRHYTVVPVAKKEKHLFIPAF